MKLRRLHLERGFFRNDDGEAVYLIGFNFWPKTTGPMMYRDPWDGGQVGIDLDGLAALGANVARLFCFTPDFMPAADVLSQAALSRLEQTIAMCAERGMWVMPTFLVGHMSGENWDPAWRGERDWFTDVELLQSQELLLTSLAGRYAGDPRVAAWIVTNEWPLYAGSTSAPTGIAWARRMAGALRAVDPQTAISLGDGAWDLVAGQDYGLPALGLLDVVDFFGPHFYPKETDWLRHSFVASFSMRMVQPLGRPVLLEEFGCSSDQADDEFAADYYRTTLWTALAAGNCGALAWNSHDFELPNRRPYSHHPYELHFGVLRSDGSRKPQADEFARFAALARSIDMASWSPQPASALIARSPFFLQPLPFDWGWSKSELRDLYLQTYVLCAKAKMAAGFLDLAPQLPQVDAPPPKETLSGFALLLLPCVQQITTQNVEQIERFVRDGGVAYLSHGGEPWDGRLLALAGARPRIRYGLVEMPQADITHLRMVAKFGDLQPGDIIPVRTCAVSRRDARLPCEAKDAQVIALDDGGQPALLSRKLGKGHIVFAAYPIEAYLMRGADANESDESWRLYQALAVQFGCCSRIKADHPLVEIFVWRHNSSPHRIRLFAINHSWEPVEFFLSPGQFSGTDLESGAVLSNRQSWSLPKKGVRVLDMNLSA